MNENINLCELLRGHVGEICVFPSKDHRDWNKWVEEQKHKVPKTWNELVNDKRCKMASVVTHSICGENTGHDYPIERAALALLKIHQLIEVGYGGNITDEEWENPNIHMWYIHSDTLTPIRLGNVDSKQHILFHTEEQAKEFISHLENIQLIKDFYMI